MKKQEGEERGFPLANDHLRWKHLVLALCMQCPSQGLHVSPTISFGHRASFPSTVTPKRAQMAFGRCQLCPVVVFLGRSLDCCVFSWIPGIASNICRLFEAPILVRQTRLS